VIYLHVPELVLVLSR